MKVNGLMANEKIRWRKVLVCTCSGKLEKCQFCRYEIAEKSIPKENFVIKESKVDKKGKQTGEMISRTIKEITIIRGDHDDVIAWKF